MIILWLFFLIVWFVVCFLRVQRIKSQQFSCSKCPYNVYLKIFQSLSNYVHTACWLRWLLSITDHLEHLEKHLLLHVVDFPYRKPEFDYYEKYEGLLKAKKELIMFNYALQYAGFLPQSSTFFYGCKRRNSSLHTYYLYNMNNLNKTYRCL